MNTIRLAALLIGFVLAACGKIEQPEAHEGEEHAEESGRSLALTAEQLKAAGIETATAGPAQIREFLTLYGTIRPNSEAIRQVTARYPGVIRTVAHKVGDAVKAGDALATIESNESLQTYAVTAPIGGVVTHRAANPGEGTGEAVLFTVADLSTVWVEVALFPRDVAKVRVAQSVRVRRSEGGAATDGAVVYVAPLGENASQTLTARVSLRNAAGSWAPGLYVIADVLLGEAAIPVTVRNSSLQSLDDEAVVFVQTAKGFEARAVATGRSDGDNTEITSGMTAGERYAATNSFVLKSELGKGQAGHDH